MSKLLTKLRIPFPEDDIEWRIQQQGLSNGIPWALVLAYVTNRAIMDRLDEVVGPENWTNDFTQSPNGGVLCTLGIRVDDDAWVYKTDGADNTEIEKVKGGLSNAMKRAGVQWGIGRYLYKLPTTFATFGGEGRKTRIEGEIHRWNPPQLTEEFLPPQLKTENKETK